MNAGLYFDYLLDNDEQNYSPWQATDVLAWLIKAYGSAFKYKQVLV